MPYRGGLLPNWLVVIGPALGGQWGEGEGPEGGISGVRRIPFRGINHSLPKSASGPRLA